MNAAHALQAVGEERCLRDVCPHWQEAMAELPAERPVFLVPHNAIENRRWSGLDRELDPVLCRIADRLEAL